MSGSSGEEHCQSSGEASKTEATRCRLIAILYRVFLENTETFEAVGCPLAYLLGAVAEDKAIEYSAEFKAQYPEFDRVVTEQFPSDHWIWEFLNTTTQ